MRWLPQWKLPHCANEAPTNSFTYCIGLDTIQLRPIHGLAILIVKIICIHHFQKIRKTFLLLICVAPEFSLTKRWSTMISYPIRSMLWHIYLHLLDIYGKYIGINVPYMDEYMGMNPQHGIPEKGVSIRTFLGSILICILPTPRKRWSTKISTNYVKIYTLPETNISPENGPLEKEIPIGNHQF